MTSATALAFALAATHRVIDWVHDHAAHGRATPLPARAAGLAADHVHVIDVADLADRGKAGFLDLPDFAGRHFDKRVAALAIVQDRDLACAARNLAAVARTKLDVVNVRAERNDAERKRVADFRRRVWSRHHFRADRQADRPEDVALLAVGVLDQRNARGAVRIVLDADHGRFNAVFLALEINDAIAALVAAA